VRVYLYISIILQKELCIGNGEQKQETLGEEFTALGHL
jgi:hypothetical protein